MKKPFYKRWWFIAIVIFMVIAALGSGGEDKEDKADKEIEYRIVEKDDVSFANIKRPSWEVVIEEEVTAKELQELSKDIVEQAKKEDKFNAIVIWFYDYEEYIGSGYTLGKTEYAPDGEWSKADTVKAGDYKSMDYKYHMMEKDWRTRLTKDEVKIYREWKELVYDKEIEEDDAILEVAEKNDITTEEVDAILFKWIMWGSNDLSK